MIHLACFRSMAAAMAMTAAGCSGAPILVSAPMMPTDGTQTHAALVVPGSVEGDWEGRGVQESTGGGDAEVSWAMVIHITTLQEGLSAQVTYPDEGCFGDWTMHEVDKDLWEGDETIRRDPNHKCIATGAVTLHKLDDGTLEWTWEGIDPNSGADLSAHATLSRAQPATPARPAQPPKPRGR